MKTHFRNQLFFLLILFTHQVFSQAGMWTWISGSNLIGAPGVYGVQGIPSVNNHPPGLYEYTEWKDLQGNFWLYGGFSPSYSDLWKYDPVTNEWTWVKGNGMQGLQPVYGSIGVSDPANFPGKRMYCSASWTDMSGHLWLFGGDNSRNDLWKYDISTNEWTWMSGTNVIFASGIYGTKGVPSSTNLPPGRSETCSAWTDSMNNLWLFGGYDNNGDNLNDLWRYSITTNEWTWMSGSSFSNSFSVYGTKGIPAPANVPGARISYSKWKDKSGNFWLMGGSEWPDFNDDVWKFDPGINQWTWMAGTNMHDDAGNYITKCVLDSINRPGSRAEHRSTVTDNCGRFWMFGGTDPSLDYLNDLWVFSPDQAKWMWLSGTNQVNQSNVYGTIGVPSPTNSPASRWGSISWWGNDNRFYLFGGSDMGTSQCFAELWVYTPDSNCTPTCGNLPVAGLTSPNEICPGSCIDFTNSSLSATSYQWIFTGASISGSTDENPQNVCYNTPGSYDVTLIAFGITGSDTLMLPGYITVFPFPSAQGILQIGDTLFANQGSVSYQWYFNNTIINGATNYYYVATQNGDYNVVCTDTNNCEVEAVLNDVLTNLSQDNSKENKFKVYPNPAGESLSISGFSSTNEVKEICIYNMLGEKLISQTFSDEDQKNDYTIDIHFIPSGCYYLVITLEKKTIPLKFLKQ